MFFVYSKDTHIKGEVHVFHFVLIFTSLMSKRFCLKDNYSLKNFKIFFICICFIRKKIAVVNKGKVVFLLMFIQLSSLPLLTLKLRYN